MLEEKSKAQATYSLGRLTLRYFYPDMASRKEEKERRRRERLEREQREEESTSRRMVIIIVGGIIVAVAAVVVVAVLAFSGGGGDKKESKDSGGELNVEAIEPPTTQIRNLDEAAKKAGCTLKSNKEEGDSHIDPSAEVPKYKANPPTSGDHDAKPLEDIAYGRLEKRKIMNSLHSLEHGRIIYQHRGIADKQLRQLKGLYDENPYHVVLMENLSNMPYEVAATAWTEQLLCKKMDDSAFDALRAFNKEFVDQGPEFVP